ncbi:VanZ family protein [Tautonia sociabilis]|nr:VanZ family protein [Tautonia sociabilis]
MSETRGHRSDSVRPAGPAPLRRRRRAHPLTFLAGLCALFIVYGTTIPFLPEDDPMALAEGWRLALDAASLRSSRTDRVANILLFLPLGASIAARLGRAGIGPIGAVLAASAAGSALSVGVETAQINLQMRVTSVSDVLHNTAGSAFGGLLGWLASRAVWPVIRPRLRLLARSRPMATLAIVGAAGWAFVELAPFVPSADVGDLKQAVKASRPIPFGPSVDGRRPDPAPGGRAVEALTWALLGGAVALAMREAGLSGVGLVLGTVAVSAAVVAGAEVLQLGFPGHVTDATSVLFASAGAAAAGLAVASRPREPSGAWIGPALAVWALAVLIDGARPLDTLGPPRGLDIRMAFPFYSYFWSPPTAALATASEKVATMVPLGLLLAAGSRRWTPARSARVGFASGVAIEVVQVFNASRTPDLTDGVLAAAGAWLGASAWRAWDSSRTDGR